MNPISPISLVEPLEITAGASSVTTPASGEFRSMVESAIQKVETSGAGAARTMEQFVSGEAVDLHNVALASQKAALDFDMFLQVRNKVVQAYQEVMRLQL